MAYRALPVAFVAASTIFTTGATPCAQAPAPQVQALSIASSIAPTAQPKYGPAAATRILGGPVVTLEARAPDWGAYAAAFNLLRMAGVRFVLEGAPVDPDVPQVDLARPPGDTIFLTGLSVGAALDRIGRENPRFRWTERDGVIVARLTPGNAGVLAMNTPRFAVTSANGRAAMGALVEAVAPAWDAAARIAIDRRPGMTPGLPVRPAAPVRLVSLNLATAATVEDVLVRLARESGGWSWTVQYDRLPASIDTATITLLDDSELVTATSPSVTPRPRPFDPTALRPGRDILSLLAEFAKSADVVINMEHVPGIEPISLPRVPDFDLAGVPPATTVRRLVAHDSRYEWTERDGRFIVKPKQSTSLLLDTIVPSFVRVDEPLEAVLSDLLTRVGADTRAAPARGGRAGGAAVAEAALKTVSVEFRTPVAVRDVLDTLADRAGGASWSLRGGPLQNNRSSYGLTITGRGGWTVSRAFTVFEHVRPARAPEVDLPPELDRDVHRSVHPDAWLISPYLSIAASAAAPVGIEFRPERAFERDPRYIRIQQLSFLPSPPQGRFGNHLSVQLERDPPSALRVRNGVVNVAPRDSWALPRHFLDQPIGRFTADSQTVWQIAVALRQRLNPRALKGTALATTLPQFGPGRENQWARTLTFSLENPTAREVLNTLVAQHGNLAWLMRYQSLQPDRDAEVRNADAVLVLALLNSAESAGLQVDHNGAMTLMRTPGRGSPFAVARQPGTPPPGPPAHLYFPLRGDAVDVEIDRLCRGLGARCVSELLNSQARQLRTEDNYAYFDFTGLGIEEALTALMRILPNLTWRREGALYRIRSRGLDGLKDLPLDHRVAAFEHDMPTLPSIRDALRGLLLQAAAERALAQSGTSAPADVAASLPARQGERPVAVRMRNATIREIFHEIARLHGEVTWSVRYLFVNGTMPQLDFSLSVRNSTTGSTIYLPPPR